MSGSHSLDLIIDAVRSAEISCWGKTPSLPESPDTYTTKQSVATLPEHGIAEPAVSRFSKLTYALNRLPHLVGLHVSRVSVMRRTTRAAAESLKSATESLEAAEKAGDRTTEALRTALVAYASVWYDGTGKAIGMGTMLSVLSDMQGFDDVYASLADDSSRRVFDWFVRFRVAYGLVGEEARNLFPAEESSASFAQRCWGLPKAPGGGFVVGDWTIDSDAGVIVDSVVLEQYCLRGVVEPEPGSVILDIGAYKGETAIWFAGKAGPTGAVYAFEPDPAVTGTLTANIERNKGLGQAHIVPVPYGIGGVPGKLHFASTHSGGSHMDPDGTTTVDVTTIDLAVEQLRLDRVDFIKMDIEGGEVEALHGAKTTLRKFAPTLAICVYHRPHDLPDIAAIMRKARPDYSLYLSHKSPNWNETVLFASVPKRRTEQR